MKFKRGVNLILGQYRYKKDGKYKEKLHWRCTILGQGCRGRLHTTRDGENLEVVHQVEHNHRPDENATAGIILKATLCDQAKQQEAVPLPEVYSNIMSEQNLDEDIMPPSYNSVRSLMHRARRQDQPQIPRRRQDIDLSGDYSLTLDQQQFFFTKTPTF